jgi:hypothetical protein
MSTRIPMQLIAAPAPRCIWTVGQGGGEECQASDRGGPNESTLAFLLSLPLWSRINGVSGPLLQAEDLGKLPAESHAASDLPMIGV